MKGFQIGWTLFFLGLGLGLGVGSAPVLAQDTAAVLFSGRIASSVQDDVTDRLGEIVDLVPGDDFRQAAEEAGLDWQSDEAFESLLGEAGLDLAVFVQAQARGIRVTLWTGNGESTAEEQLSRRDAGDLASLVEDLVIEWQEDRGSDTSPDEYDEDDDYDEDDASDEDDEDNDPSDGASGVRPQVRLGLGLAERTLKLDDLGGTARLDLGGIVTFVVEADVFYRPEGSEGSAYGVHLSYQSSVGVEVEDQRSDGTVNTSTVTDRAFDLRLSLRGRYADGTVLLGAAIGYGIHDFSSGSGLTIQDYGLSGPLLEGWLTLDLLDGDLAIHLRPRLRVLVSGDDTLVAPGSSETGGIALGLGADVGIVGYPSRMLGLFAKYREEHAILTAGRDVSRIFTIGAEYRP